MERKRQQITTLRSQLDLAKKDLASTDGSSDKQVARQRNLVRQAQLRLSTARERLEDYQIIAEFDGRVRSVDIVE